MLRCIFRFLAAKMLRYIFRVLAAEMIRCISRVLAAENSRGLAFGSPVTGRTDLRSVRGHTNARRQQISAGRSHFQSFGCRNDPLHFQSFEIQGADLSVSVSGSRDVKIPPSQAQSPNLGQLKPTV